MIGIEDWINYLKENNLKGSDIVIEITESLLMENENVISEKLLKFRDEGVKISLDDFGTGYSSLSYIKKFDIDYIKIDISIHPFLLFYNIKKFLCQKLSR